MQDKEKLTTILREIISRGRSGAKVESKAFASIVGEENFDKKIKHKIKIFQNVPEESKMFSIIYDTAKRALGDLKKNVVNIHSFELVKLFYTLDEQFSKNLSPINFVDIEDEAEKNIKKEVGSKEDESKTFCEQIKEKNVVSQQEKVIELQEGVTGIEFLSAKIMDQKSFDDLTQALENL